MAEISVRIPEGEPHSFPQGVAAGEALKALVSSKVRKQTVAVRCNGVSLDLSASLAGDCVLEPIAADSAEGPEILRHSAAHVMALAVR